VCHFQRITHATPGFVRQFLDGVLRVKVSNQHGIFMLEQALDSLLENLFPLFRKLIFPAMSEVVFNQFANFYQMFGGDTHN